MKQRKRKKETVSKYTDISILLDRSGSMETIKDAMEKAFDKFVEEHKAVPSTRLSLIQFDSGDDQEIVYMGVPVSHVEKLNLKPRGGTPLLDAFVKAIDRTGNRLRNMKEEERPDQVLFIVITDGQENASKEFKRTDVFDRVKRQTDLYNWQFVYLGANQDAIAEAASFGISHDFAATYQHTRGGASAGLGAITSNTVNYVSNSGEARGKTKGLGFTDKQRKEAEDA